jgi:hypothetical protein
MDVMDSTDDVIDYLADCVKRAESGEIPLGWGIT